MLKNDLNVMSSYKYNNFNYAKKHTTQNTQSFGAAPKVMGAFDVNPLGKKIKPFSQTGILGKIFESLKNIFKTTKVSDNLEQMMIEAKSMTRKPINSYRTNVIKNILTITTPDGNPRFIPFDAARIAEVSTPDNESYINTLISLKSKSQEPRFYQGAVISDLIKIREANPNNTSYIDKVINMQTENGKYAYQEYELPLVTRIANSKTINLIEQLAKEKAEGKIDSQQILYRLNLIK